MPWPPPFDLYDQGPAQERAHDHEQAEDHDVLQGWFESYGPDDVCGHEKLQSQQQCLSELDFVLLLSAADLPAEVKEIAYRAVRDGHDDDRYSKRFNPLGRQLNQMSHPCYSNV